MLIKNPVTDLPLLKDGTLSFSYKEEACIGVIEEIEYLKAEKVIFVSLKDVRSVLNQRSVFREFLFDIRLDQTKMTFRPKEFLIVSRTEGELGRFFSFRGKE